MYVRCALLLVCLLASSMLTNAESFSLSQIPSQGLAGIRFDDPEPVTNELKKSIQRLPVNDAAFHRRADDVLPLKWEDLAREIHGNHFGFSSPVFDAEEFRSRDKRAGPKPQKGPQWKDTPTPDSRGTTPETKGPGTTGTTWGPMAETKPPAYDPSSVAVTPEPSTVLLLGTGLSLIGLKLRKKRR
jgi:hypothetical protein